MIGLDKRIAEGMRAQLALRDERLASGDRQIGWKVGFGAPAAAARLGIDRPLVGFLLESGVLSDDAQVPVGAWARPALEPEIAVRLARDIGPAASREDVRQAVGGLAPAIELADVDPPPTDVRAILAGNIFHRHVQLGPFDGGRSTAEGVRARVARNGKEIASTEDPEAATGEMLEVVRLTAELLGACGERLRAGEVVITGSVVPPIAVASGDRIEAHLPPLGSLRVRLAD